MFEAILKKFWGYDAFRPLQKEIIESVASGHDTLGILPTGGGKSITFQVPGLALEGTAIVVTPLISLMKDQVDNLRKRRIQATFLHSGMSLREKNLAYERLFNNKAKFLYVSPERLGSDSFLREISRLRVNLIVVDEAHCISQWGYDFRPSYLKVKRLRKLFPDVPVLALTASATERVAKDICLQLEFRPDSRTFRGSVRRERLSYVVRSSEGKLHDIGKILSSVGGSAIVYARSRKKTREIAEYLGNAGISATFYHAGLDNEVKEERHNGWMRGEYRVMVATNAFGMGIDKADVRIVIHFDLPPSLEEYYQEAGRAGRDGRQAYAVLLTAKSDKATLRRRLTMEFPPKDVIRKIYTRLCVFSDLEIGEGYDRTVEFDLVKFLKTYSMEEAVVRPALRILGQAGYVEFIEEFENSSRLMVTVDRDELYNVRLSNDILERILTTVLRTYPGIFSDYVFINEKRISALTGFDNDTVYSKLVELSKRKVISYIPRRKTPLLYFPTSMEEERYVGIGKAVYEERMAVMRERIEAMIEFAYGGNNCRLETLSRYFGESDDRECGHCDVCREKKKSGTRRGKMVETKEKLWEFFRTHTSGVSDKEMQEYFGSNYEAVTEMLRDLREEGVVTKVNDKYFLTT